VYIAQATDVASLPISDDAKAFIRATVLKKFLSGEDATKVQELAEKESMNQDAEDVDKVDDSTEPNGDEPNLEKMATQGGTEVQSTALNGAQVTSLVEIIASVKNTTIPKSQTLTLCYLALYHKYL
jgi:hypothetical protein